MSFAEPLSNKSCVSLKRLHCPYHEDAHLIEDHHAGDLICPECGLVVGDRVIDVGSEWRTFSESDKGAKDMCRVGESENALLDGVDLSTSIGLGTGQAAFDDNGRPLYKNRNQMSSANRTLLGGYREITTIADRLNVPKSIIEKASTVFKQVQATKALKSRNKDIVAAACLYIACRQEGVPRTFKEFCGVSKASKTEIGRVFKLVLKTLETSVELITTGDFMNRFCTNLELSNTIKRAADFIARRAVELDVVTGRSPLSVAAAAIYMASQASSTKKSAKEIADISGVGEATIKTSYRLMQPQAHNLFPKDFQFATPIEQLP